MRRRSSNRSSAVRVSLVVCAVSGLIWACQQTAPTAPANSAASSTTKKTAQDAGGSETGEQLGAAGNRTAVSTTVGLTTAGMATASYTPRGSVAGASAAGAPTAATGTSTPAGSVASPCPANVAWVYPTAIPAANLSLWQYARAQLGHVVGDGQCSDIIGQWQSTNHLTVPPLTTSDGAGDYVWGTLVATISSPTGSVASVLPGDIVQFKNVQTQLTDASGVTTSSTETHHTAIVSAVAPGQNALCLLEQNSTTAPPVNYGYLSISSLQTGVLHIYRYSN